LRFLFIDDLQQFIVARSEGGSAQSLRASTQLIPISNLDS
jgi:hypothetical protein